MSSQYQRRLAFAAAMAILTALAGCDGGSDPAPDVTLTQPDLAESPVAPANEEPAPIEPDPNPPEDPSASSSRTVCPKDVPPGPYDDRAAQCVEIFGTTTIEPNETQTLACRGWGEHPAAPQFRDMYEVATDHPKTWLSSDEEIFTVSVVSSFQATITGVAPGTAEVRCRIDQAPWGYATVTVTGTRTLVSMHITPNPVPPLFPGETREVATNFVDNYNQTNRIHPPVDEWTSDNPGVATVGEPLQFGGQVATVRAIASAGPDTDGIARVRARVGSIWSSPSTITVRPAPRLARPIADVSNPKGSFTPSSGTQLWAMLDEDAADGETSYVDSGPMITGKLRTFVVLLSSLGSVFDPGNGVEIRVTSRRRNVSGTGTLRQSFALYQGTSVIASSTSLTLGSSGQYVVHTLTLTQAQINTISNPADLRVGVTGSFFGGTLSQSAALRVTHIVLEN